MIYMYVLVAWGSLVVISLVTDSIVIYRTPTRRNGAAALAMFRDIAARQICRVRSSYYTTVREKDKLHRASRVRKTQSRYTRKVEPLMQDIPDESDFATEMQERSARHPFLMLAWVGVDYLVEELLTAQVTIEDKFRRSFRSPPH